MKFGIIGAGKVGTSIACILKRKGFEVVALSSRTENSLQRAKSYIDEEGTLFTMEKEEVIKRAEVIGITTQDGNIAEVVGEIVDKFSDLKGKTFFHTSGAHPSSLLEPLKKRGAFVGSLHPLQTFPDIDSAIKSMKKAYIFVEGDSEAKILLKKIGKVLGRKVFEIESEKKILYHLSAVFLCNLLCALLFGGERILKEINIPFEPFLPLIKQTLKNIEDKGPVRALTGPLTRGDKDTVISHLKALEGKELEKAVYKALSLLALEIVRERGEIEREKIKEMEVILR